MKTSEGFKKSISHYLEGRALEDPLFAETLKKTDKNIDGCINYILNEVKNSGCNGFEDSEIYGMAVHYYDEDDLKAGPPVKCQVVVNHVTELSPEEVQKAKEAAFDRIVSEEQARIKTKAPKQEQKLVVQQSLF